MADKETIGIEDKGKKGCKKIKEKQVSLQLWEVTVRCPDGREKIATSANKNEAEQLACPECDEA